MQWFEFAKTHKDNLKAWRIPSNLRSVYMQRGVWKGWSDVLAPNAN